MASSGAINTDEFEVKQDFSIDMPVMKEMGIMGNTPINQPSIGPQPQNEVRDMSGWGIIGKLHPSLTLKDKMIKAYHNRQLDPRYTHLKGYGHLAKHTQVNPPSAKKHNGLF